MFPANKGLETMEQSKQSWRWLRVVAALLFGLLLLAALLSSTGGIIEGPPLNPEMWRCGPFLFFPTAFFGVVAFVIVATSCTLFGIVRRNVLETVGWCLLGILLLVVICGA
jgi:hypothetical protein